MELNVIKKAGANATPQVLVRAIKRADAILARLIAAEKYLEGATAFTAPTHAMLPSANGAADVRLPPGVSAQKVLDTIDAHFAAAGTACLSLDVSEIEWPVEFKAAIEARGFHAVEREVHLLAAYAPPAVDGSIQVIPGRAAYGEVRSALEVHAAALHSTATAAQQWVVAAMDHLDDSRVDAFLARHQRKPAAVATLLTLGNIGVLLNLFALPTDHAAAAFNTVAARLFDHCLRAQFEQVIVRVDANDPQIGPLAALGFRRVAGYVSYVKSNPL